METHRVPHAVTATLGFDVCQPRWSDAVDANQIVHRRKRLRPSQIDDLLCPLRPDVNNLL